MGGDQMVKDVNSSNFIVVDVGTEGTKSALISETGQIISTSFYEYSLQCPKPHWATQDPQVWWYAVKKTIREVIESSKIDPRSIVAMGVCGQMHAPIPISKDGEILYSQPPLWCDKRNIEQCEELRNRINEAEIIEVTGNPITPAWMGLKIKWIKEKFPSIYEKTYKFLTPKDTIIFLMTEQFVTDFSEASGTFLFDCKKLKWSPELAEMLKIDLDKMPDVFPSHKVIGELKQDVARELKLKTGIPVIAGGGDFPCAMLGAGGISDDIAIDIAGTSSLMAISLENIKTDQRLMNLHHVIDGWILFNEVEAGLLRWFRDNFAESEIKMAKRRNTTAYRILDEEAEIIPAGSNGLIVFPHFIGERMLGRYYCKGGIVGLSLMHTKKHLFRALIEGITYELRRVLDIIEEVIEKQIPIVRLVGGGSVSRLMREIRTNVYGRKIELLESFQGGLYGLVILCMLGLKFDGGNVQKIVKKLIRVSDHLVPKKELHEIYEKYYMAYKEIYHSMSTLCACLRSHEIHE